MIPKGASNIRVEQYGHNNSKDHSIYLGKDILVVIIRRKVVFFEVQVHVQYIDDIALILPLTPCSTDDVMLSSALRDSNNSFILNGNLVVSSHKKHLHVKGSMLEYSGSDNVIEVINGTRMLDERLYLMVSGGRHCI